MKIKARLLSSILIVILIFAIGNVFAIFKMRNMQKSAIDINKNRIPKMMDIQVLIDDNFEISRLIRVFIAETDYDLIDDDANQLHAKIAEISKTQQQYESLISSQDERLLYEKYKTYWNEYTKQIDNILALGKDKNFELANKMFWEAYSSWSNVNLYMDYIIKLNYGGIQKSSSDISAATSVTITLSIILSIAASILGLIIAYLISSDISKSLAILNVGFNKIADGNLNDQIKVRSKDEFGELAKGFNKMSEDLRKIVKEVIDTAVSLSATSEELSASAEEATASSEQVSATIGQLATGAAAQAKSEEDAGAMIKQLLANALQVVANAENVSQSSARAAKAAEAGADQAENAKQKITQIREVSDQTVDAVSRLGKQSQQIGQIVDVIQGIADQTNLLALNAAIEAARAGEQGRGFAVVAEEVRKLAEQSSASAQQISSVIVNIQRETDHAVNMMDKGNVEVAAGVAAVNSAVDAFNTIVEEIHTVVEQILQVSDASQQMVERNSLVVKSIDNIGIIAGQTAASTQEVSAASDEQVASMVTVSKAAEVVAKHGEGLMFLIGKFKV